MVLCGMTRLSGMKLSSYSLRGMPISSSKTILMLLMPKWYFHPLVIAFSNDKFLSRLRKIGLVEELWSWHLIRCSQNSLRPHLQALLLKKEFYIEVDMTIFTYKGDTSAEHCDVFTYHIPRLNQGSFYASLISLRQK